MRRAVRSRRRGVTMLELAFVIFMLLGMTMGIVQYGFLHNAMLSLNNLAREGSRFAAVRAEGLSNDSAGRAQLQRTVEQYVLRRAKGTIIEQAKPSTMRITVQAPNLYTNAPVRVSIKYDLVANQSFVPAIIPLSSYYSDYEASAVNLIE